MLQARATIDDNLSHYHFLFDTMVQAMDGELLYMYACSYIFTFPALYAPVWHQMFVVLNLRTGLNDLVN